MRIDIKISLETASEGIEEHGATIPADMDFEKFIDKGIAFLEKLRKETPLAWMHTSDRNPSSLSSGKRETEVSNVDEEDPFKGGKVKEKTCENQSIRPAKLKSKPKGVTH